VSLRRFLLPLVFLTVIAGLMDQAAMAQDIRVYTEVMDVAREGGSKELSHSVTYFHAGSAYDYMPDVGEVVIFEPIHSRFIILGDDYSATEVSFAEVNHFLETAQTETVKYINELSVSSEKNALLNSKLLQFQLAPDFRETFDPNTNQLSMTGSYLSYNVKATKVESPNIVLQYLEYADWAKRLNYVLHPQPTLPNARLQLNEALRKRQLLPTEVEMSLHLDPPVRFKVVHEFSEKLQPIDRQHIRRWEQLINGDQIRWMTFHEYQQNLLAELRH